jgi:hypothetical protein
LDNVKENKTEQWALRKLLSENGAPIVIGGSVTLIDTVNNYNMPFYDFSQFQRLYKLNSNEFAILSSNLVPVLVASDKTDTTREKVSAQNHYLSLQVAVRVWQ